MSWPDYPSMTTVIFIGLIIGGLLACATTPTGFRANPKLICPHCGARGCISTGYVPVDDGISGAKVAAAIVTGGVSALATGLSKKRQGTRCWCRNCSSHWTF